MSYSKFQASSPAEREGEGGLSAGEIGRGRSWCNQWKKIINEFVNSRSSLRQLRLRPRGKRYHKSDCPQVSREGDCSFWVLFFCVSKIDVKMKAMRYLCVCACFSWFVKWKTSFWEGRILNALHKSFIQKLSWLLFQKKKCFLPWF